MMIIQGWQLIHPFALCQKGLIDIVSEASPAVAASRDVSTLWTVGGAVAVESTTTDVDTDVVNLSRAPQLGADYS